MYKSQTATAQHPKKHLSFPHVFSGNLIVDLSRFPIKAFGKDNRVVTTNKYQYSMSKIN